MPYPGNPGVLYIVLSARGGAFDSARRTPPAPALPWGLKCKNKVKNAKKFYAAPFLRTVLYKI